MNISNKVEEIDKLVNEIRAMFEKITGKKLGGSVEYYLREMNLGLFVIKLSLINPKEKDWDFIRHEIREYQFYLKQIKFMSYMCGYIKKPKENPNQVLEEHLYG